jgi:hypothetical protein
MLVYCTEKSTVHKGKYVNVDKEIDPAVNVDKITSSVQ